MSWCFSLPLLRPSSFLIIISSSSSAAGRKETAWQRLRQHSVPESCFNLEAKGKHYFISHNWSSNPQLNGQLCCFYHHEQLYLEHLSPLSVGRFIFAVRRHLAAAQGGDGTGPFQVIGHQLQNAGNFFWHRYSLYLQDLPFEEKKSHWCAHTARNTLTQQDLQTVWCMVVQFESAHPFISSRQLSSVFILAPEF